MKNTLLAAMFMACTMAGNYSIRFGASVEDIRAMASYRQGKALVVKCHDVMRPSMELK